MKIHRVAMTGFGPYRDTETVDFDTFDDDGIFLITGKTGAGKTSILDAITFALFGSIPRYDGAAGEKVRSDYIGPTDRCEVELEFSTNEVRYRATRSPAYERPKLRGSGTTTQPAAFELAWLNGSNWEVSESRLGNAETRIDEIIRLNAKQFLQVILLAQGQFQEFLVANSDKRRDLLRMLFDTKRFSDYSDTLDARVRALGAQLKTSSTAIGTNSESLARETGQPIPETVDLDGGTGVHEWVDQLVAAHQGTVAQATLVLTQRQVALDAAREVFDSTKSIAERQHRRARSLARKAELEIDRVAADTLRTQLIGARKAALVWHTVEASGEGKARLETAQSARRSAEEIFRQLLPDAPDDSDSLSSSVQQLTELLGSLREAVEREKTLDHLETQVQKSTEDLAAFDRQAEVDNKSRAALRTELGLLIASLANLEVSEIGLLTAEQTVISLAARHNAALMAERTNVELRKAVETRLDAGRAVTAASAMRDKLRESQRDGYAGVLAQALTPGEPCHVCGSLSHPLPAVLADDHVDAAAVEKAEADYEQTVRGSNQADQEVTKLTTRLESEGVAAGGETSSALAPQVAAAELAKDQAAREFAKCKTAKIKGNELTAEIERLGTAIDLAQVRHTDLVAVQSAAAASLTQAVCSLTEPRGTHDSVATRLVKVESHAGATRALLNATSTLQDAADQVATTEEALVAALTEHQFADAAAVVAARVSTAEQDTLESTVAAYDTDSKAVSEALAADDLKDLPADPVDLGAPQTAYNAADALNKQAIAEESAAKQKLATIDGLAIEISETLASAKELHEQYGVVNRLASTVRGQTPNTMKMMLETFALAAELEDIVKSANSRLKTMTGGRYEFLHSDAMAKGGAQSGLALDVLDAYTGDTRPPQSLSGGEKFQASLALALGLAEVLTNRAGGLRLDTLFIDEGFGSLDSDTLETTMATLDNLRDGGRTIGLISHVEAMKESIPAQLFVDVTDGGWSTIREP